MRGRGSRNQRSGGLAGSSTVTTQVEQQDDANDSNSSSYDTTLANDSERVVHNTNGNNPAPVESVAASNRGARPANTAPRDATNEEEDANVAEDSGPANRAAEQPQDSVNASQEDMDAADSARRRPPEYSEALTHPHAASSFQHFYMDPTLHSQVTLPHAGSYYTAAGSGLPRHMSEFSEFATMPNIYPSEPIFVNAAANGQQSSPSSFCRDRNKLLKFVVEMLLLAAGLFCMIVGSIFVVDCPVEPKIPAYLLVMGVLLLLTASNSCFFISGPCKCSKEAVLFLLFLLGLSWLVCGSVWTVGVMDRVTFGKRHKVTYCNRTLYISSYVFSLVSLLLFIILTCVVVCSPAASDVNRRSRQTQTQQTNNRRRVI